MSGLGGGAGLPHGSFLFDLGIRARSAGDGAFATLPHQTHLYEESGLVGAGVIATLIDTAAGRFAVRAAAPDLVATSLISLQLLRPCSRAPLSASARLLRRGRSSLSLDVSLVEGADEAGTPIGLGTASFSLLSVPEEMLLDSGRLTGGMAELEIGAHPMDLGELGTPLERPYLEQIGLRVLDAPSGCFELEHSDYTVNHIGALQGGIVATLCQVAAERAALAATGKHQVTHDLTVQYLSPGRVGPFRTTAHVVRATPSATAARVELRDAGADHRLMAVATANTLG